MKDAIKFDWLGLHLQEPMGIIMNMLIALFCLFAFFQLQERRQDEAVHWWKLFFLTFGVSTFLGGLAHGFFYYFGVPGKFPCWILGCLANIFAAKGMLSFPGYENKNRALDALVWSKSLILLAAALITQKFIFITIDAILTYLSFTGGYALLLVKRGLKEVKLMVIGVIVLIPSSFIFLQKINPHRWLNKDDLSHVLMLGCILCFYLGMTAWANRETTQTNNV